MEFVFPHGALALRVEAATDFTRRGQADEQARDPDTGERVWTVTVLDNDPAATRFGRSAEVKVKIAAPREPVLPEPQYPGVPPLVEFEGLMLTPWTDSSRCIRSDPCKARLAYSIRASAVVAPRSLPPAAQKAA